MHYINNGLNFDINSCLDIDFGPTVLLKSYVMTFSFLYFLLLSIDS